MKNLILKFIFINEKIFINDLNNFRHRKLTLKVRIMQTAEDQKYVV